MEFLAIALLATVLTKTISDARTDHEYAKQGLVSPRLDAKYGAGAAAKTSRYGYTDYLKDAWSTHWQCAQAALEADKAERIANPKRRVPLRQRVATGRAVMAKAYRKLVDPIEAKPTEPAEVAEPVALLPAGDVPPGTWTTGSDGERVELNPTADEGPADAGSQSDRGSAPVRFGLIDREMARRAALSPEESAAEEEWRARADAAQAAKEKAMIVDPRWRRQNGFCMERANGPAADHGYCPGLVCRHDRHGGSPTNDLCCYHTVAGQAPSDNPTTAIAPSTGGPAMTTPTGEAVNYETTIAELEAQAAELREHVDHCQQAKDHIEGAKGAISDMQDSYRATSQAAGLTVEHLEAKHLDDTTMTNAGTVVDALPDGVVDTWFDQLEEMEQVAKERLEAAEAALSAVEANLTHIAETHGDSAANVAENLSGDASFLDSGGSTTTAETREPVAV
jgi:hypothetical protein